MTRPLIAITPSIQKRGEEFSDRSISLSLCYTHSVEAAGGVPLVAPVSTDPEVLNRFLDSVDAVVLTGGGDVDPGFYDKRLKADSRAKLRDVDPVRDEMELHLIRAAHRRALPVLGICRGHQILNVAFGGTLIVDIPTQVRNHLRHGRIDKKNDAVHSIAVEPDTKLASIFARSRLDVNSSHHQAVDKPGNGLRVSAVAADGVIEGIETTDDSFTVGVQFHPERIWQKQPAIFPLFRALIDAAKRRR